jgi:hypothetical protein
MNKNLLVLFFLFTTVSCVNTQLAQMLLVDLMHKNNSMSFLEQLKI